MGFDTWTHAGTHWISMLHTLHFAGEALQAERLWTRNHDHGVVVVAVEMDETCRWSTGIQGRWV